MSKQKSAALALGGALAGLTLAGSAFAMQPLAQGYMLAAGEAGKAVEGRCGEGMCGVSIPDTDGDGRVSPQEFAAAWPAEADRFAQADANGDGYIDTEEMKAYHAGTPEGGCGAHGAVDKAGEGKCGEGKCGEGKCGGMA
ncbi:EF-hand domain-containing protein [Pseudoxanthomonas broegbernensis]|nr:EF-hand domain-containing protein [Pseudoxanthomonas broegbernensis]MBB6064036.1 putative low-complexity protein [Pseudoxanthomonas broegbernensis]